MGRPLRRRSACLVPLALLLAACAAPGPGVEVGGAGGGPALVAIRVGGQPLLLAASPAGRVLVAATCDPHGVSVIDLPRFRERWRIPVPVRERDAAGEETYGHISGLVLTADGTVAWACTTEGQVFAIDLARGVIREARELPGCSPSAIVVDEPRGRVLVGTEEGTILALEPAGPREFARPGQAVLSMAREGNLLDFVAGPTAVVWRGPPGGKPDREPDTRLYTLDLGTDTLIAEATAPTDLVTEVVRDPSGLLLAADEFAERLVVLDAHLSVVDERLIPGLGFGRVARGPGRALAWDAADGATKFFEYGLADGRVSVEPSAVYATAWKSATAVVVLDESWFAVAAYDGEAVVLVHRTWARPFSGFESVER